MKQSSTVVLFLIFILVVSATDALRAQEYYEKTTICQVLSLETNSRVLNVEIKADVMADHMHGALLTDNKCPGKGIWLGVSPKNADPSVTDFDHVLWSDGPPGFGSRTLSGTFFGKLRIGGPLPLNPKHKKISIALIRVENLLDARPHEKP